MGLYIVKGRQTAKSDRLNQYMGGGSYPHPRYCVNVRLACQIAHRKEINLILIKKYISATTYRWCFSRPGPLKLTFLTGICWQALSLRCIARTQILPSWASWGTPSSATGTCRRSQGPSSCQRPSPSQKQLLQ